MAGGRCLSWVAFAALLPTAAFGGAWTQDEGKGRAILTAGYYDASDFYNNSGTKTAQPNYHKYELNPYLEYGLYDGLTVGANLSLQRAQQNVPGARDQNSWGVGESEFFVRQRVWQQGGFVASVEPMVKLPPPDAGARPRLGSPTPDVGLGGSVGYSGQLFGLPQYADLGTQYRHRFGEQRDQFKMAATLGIGVAQDWVVMPQAFMTWRMAERSGATFTQSAADDYDLTRLQLSGVYSLSTETKLQAGAFADVDGKNAGVGRGVLLSVWQNF